MILTFADDSTMIAVDDISQAHTYCEVIDVQNGVWTFVDQHGTILRPVFPTPPRRTIFGRLCLPDSFTLTVTEERRPDLLRAIVDGRVSVERGPRIRNRDELIRELGTSC